MSHRYAKRTSAGFSLIELMISIVLGLMLMAGAVSVYLSSKTSYTEVEAYSALTENARFAETIIADALLHAGFFGEVSSEQLRNGDALIPVVDDCSGEAAAYSLSQYIFGATVSGTDAIGCIDDGMDGTDVLVIKRAVPRPLSDGARVGGVRNGTIDVPTGLQANTTYIVTNNVVGLVIDGSGTAPDIMPGGDVPGGVAWPYLFEAYYVRDPDPSSEDDAPTLARKVLSWNGAAMQVVTEDLVQGVENMQVEIGLDSDNDSEVDTYTDVSGMTSADWANVGSVDAYLLVRTRNKDPQYTDTKTYHLGGDNFMTPVAAVQQYRRTMVSTQASLRNPKLTLRR
jgi:type IV pilus assembly protein PilW